ncbi:hypothetical protein CGMCC3_g7614 [Colletotrichum fructicola]|nr:uncharacterized protein CGMCC3_g7614 [Colletotrichum fructicola]KAE9576624.1 hypothetical protein CGMCC3_g7614 [Colletotrichum fructicola]
MAQFCHGPGCYWLAPPTTSDGLLGHITPSGVLNDRTVLLLQSVSPAALLSIAWCKVPLDVADRCSSHAEACRFGLRRS